MSKICARCRQSKSESLFHKDAARTDGLAAYCKDCKNQNDRKRYSKDRNKVLAKQKARREKSPELVAKRNEYSYQWRSKNNLKNMFYQVRRRAAIRNIPFDIELDDLNVPTKCPVLGLKLEFGGKHDNRPSIDRVIPSLGYTKGNVHIISARANRIKNDGTLEELLLIADYIKRATDEVPSGCERSKSSSS